MSDEMKTATNLMDQLKQYIPYNNQTHCLAVIIDFMQKEKSQKLYERDFSAFCFLHDLNPSSKESKERFDLDKDIDEYYHKACCAPELCGHCYLKGYQK